MEARVAKLKVLVQAEPSMKRLILRRYDALLDCDLDREFHL
jgi:hypothetical protein